MTEAEWNACTDPRPMLEFLRGKVSERKLRLFAAGCCRRVWHLLADERSRSAVQIAEAFADGLATESESYATGNAAAEVNGHNLPGIPAAIGWRAAQAAAYLLPLPDDLYQLGLVWQGVATALEGEQLIRDGGSEEMLDAWSQQSVESGRTMGWTGENPDRVIVYILREIFGNPFRPASIDQQHLAVPVTALAQVIYDDRAFDRLPILADALEDAGCHDAGILTHCRGPGPHVRGCWVVDLLTGRE